MKYQGINYDIRHGIGRGFNFVELDSINDKDYPYWIRFNIAHNQKGNHRVSIGKNYGWYASAFFSNPALHTGYVDKNNRIHMPVKNSKFSNLIGAGKHYLKSNYSFKIANHRRQGISILKITDLQEFPKIGSDTREDFSEFGEDVKYYPSAFKIRQDKQIDSLKSVSKRTYKNPIKIKIKNGQKDYRYALASWLSLSKGAHAVIPNHIINFLKSFETEHKDLVIVLNNNQDLHILNNFANDFLYYDHDLVQRNKYHFKVLVKRLRCANDTSAKSFNELYKNKSYRKALNDLRHYQQNKKNSCQIKSQFENRDLASNVLKLGLSKLPNLMKSKRMSKASISNAVKILKTLHRRSRSSHKMTIRTRNSTLVAYLATCLYFKTNSANSSDKRYADEFITALKNMITYNVNISNHINEPTGRLLNLVQKHYGKLKTYYNYRTEMGDEFVRFGYFHPINTAWGRFGFRILPFDDAYDPLDMDLEDRGYMTPANEAMEKRYMKIDQHPYDNHNAVMVYAINGKEPARTDLAEYVDCERMRRSKMRLHMINDHDVDCIEKAIQNGTRGFKNPVMRKWFLKVAYTPRGREKYEARNN